MAYLRLELEKLNGLPIIAHRSLRQIRQLDQKANDIEKEIDGRQKDFINRLATASKSKKDATQKEQLDREYKEILALHDVGYALTQQKVKIADELYNALHEPTERLTSDLKKMRHEFKDEERYKDLRSEKAKALPKKVKKVKEKVQVLPPPPINEPHYCYCARPAFGEMVECENSLCDKEWFHLGCIEEKKLPDKWYCADCKRARRAQKAAKKTAKISKPKKVKKSGKAAKNPKSAGRTKDKET